MNNGISRTPRWQRAFLQALARAGNVRLACEQSPVSQAYVFLLRKRDAGFAADWQAALVASAARLANGSDGVIPPKGDRHIGAETMSVIGGYGLKPPRLVAQRGDRWSAAKERAFLDRLGSTANVRDAAKTSGLGVPTVYRHRTRRPSFAAAWDAALEIGLLTIEAQLIEAACASLDAIYVPRTEPLPIVNVRQAIMLVANHRKRKSGDFMRRGGHESALPPIDEVRADVLRKIKAMAFVERNRQGVPLARQTR